MEKKINLANEVGENAIIKSIHRDRVVYIEDLDTEEFTQVQSYLQLQSEGDTQYISEDNPSETTYEYWGYDGESCWRVHLVNIV